MHIGNTTMCNIFLSRKVCCWNEFKPTQVSQDIWIEYHIYRHSKSWISQ